MIIRSKQKSSLWVDDVREPPDKNWEWAKSAREAEALLSSNKIKEISLDYDLYLSEGEDKPKNYEAATGADVVLWAKLHGLLPPTVYIHSANPAGISEIILALGDHPYICTPLEPNSDESMDHLSYREIFDRIIGDGKEIRSASVGAASTIPDLGIRTKATSRTNNRLGRNHWRLEKYSQDEQNSGIAQPWEEVSNVPYQDLYHIAPSADRARIQTHGLQPSITTNSPRWDGSAFRDWFEDQPEGVYGWVTPQEAQRYMSMTSDETSEPMDIWRIPGSQIQEMQQDQIHPTARVVPHIVYPEMHQPYEKISPKGNPDFWEPYSPLQNPFLEKEEAHKWEPYYPEWQVGQPTYAKAKVAWTPNYYYHVAPASQRAKIEEQGLMGQDREETQSPWGWTDRAGIPQGNYAFSDIDDARGYEPPISNTNDYPGDKPELFMNYGVYPNENGEAVIEDPEQARQWFDENVEDEEEPSYIPYDPMNPEHLDRLPSHLQGHDIWQIDPTGYSALPDSERRILHGGPNDLGEAQEQVDYDEGDQEPLRWWFPQRIDPSSLKLVDHIPAFARTEQRMYDDIEDPGRIEREYPAPYQALPPTSQMVTPPPTSLVSKRGEWLPINDANGGLVTANSSQWYHLAPSRLRSQIETEGLKPGWGAGFATGQTPLTGQPDVNLQQVYLGRDPGNIGLSQKAYAESEPHDLWAVDTNDLPLGIDYPALVEHGMYIDGPNKMYFKEGSPITDQIHQEMGENLQPYMMNQNPQPFIDLTGTAATPGPISPHRLAYMGPYNRPKESSKIYNWELDNDVSRYRKSSKNLDGIFSQAEGGYGDMWINEKKKEIRISFGDWEGDLAEEAKKTVEKEYPDYKIDSESEQRDPSENREYDSDKDEMVSTPVSGWKRLYDKGEKISHKAPEPPNYRDGTKEKHCSACTMFYKGRCWGYGEFPVKDNYVCDSFEPEKKQSSIYNWQEDRDFSSEKETISVHMADKTHYKPKDETKKGPIKAKPNDEDKQSTPVHLLDTVLHNLEHVVRHVERFRDPDVQKDKGSIQFNYEHAIKHLEESVEHAEKLADHLKKNDVDSNFFKDEAKELATTKQTKSSSNPWTLVE